MVCQCRLSFSCSFVCRSLSGSPRATASLGRAIYHIQWLLIDFTSRVGRTIGPN